MLPPIPPLVPPGAEFGLGGSPFRTKGTLYIGTQSFFDEHLQGGVQEFYDDIPDAELRAFISQRFLTSGWYDVMPVPVLIAYEARALRMGLTEYLRHRSRWQAQRDLTTIHRWILRLASTRLAATRLPKVMTQMFDFATAEVVEESDAHVVVHMDGIPAVLEEWLFNALGVYGETALKLSGATFVDAATDASVPTGTRAGVPIHRLTFRLSWH